MDALTKQMSIRKPDKSLQSFIFFSIVTLSFLFLLLTVLLTVHFSLVKLITGSIELILGIFIVSFIAILCIVASSVICVYSTKYINSVTLFFAKLGLYILLPFIMALSEFLKCYKDPIRTFYINLNNIIVKTNIGKISPEKILILLPHCLQNSNCNIRITHNIDHCKKCFKCSIGYVKEFTEENQQYSVAVVTGGSVARNIVLKLKPELIIAVACERDLASGIADVKGIPTIGLLNKRPFGPCINTFVDLDEIKKVLESTSDYSH